MATVQGDFGSVKNLTVASQRESGGVHGSSTIQTDAGRHGPQFQLQFSSNAHRDLLEKFRFTRRKGTFQAPREAREAAASTAMRSGASGQRHGTRAGCFESRLGVSGDSVQGSNVAGSLGGAVPGGGRIPTRLLADCRRASSESGARDNLRESRPREAQRKA